MRKKLLTLILGVTLYTTNTACATNGEFLEDNPADLSKSKVSASCKTLGFLSKILSENEVIETTYSNALEIFMNLALISTHNIETRMITLSFTLENGETKKMLYQYPIGDQRLSKFLISQFRDFLSSIEIKS